MSNVQVLPLFAITFRNAISKTFTRFKIYNSEFKKYKNQPALKFEDTN